MIPAVLADTGPLYAAADPTDRHHARAQADLGQLRRNGMAVLLPQPILLEGYTLVMHRLGIHTAQGWLRQIQSGTNLINPGGDDYRRATATVLAHSDQALTLFDTVLAALSERLVLPIWTYDHHFDILRSSVWRS